MRSRRKFGKRHSCLLKLFRQSAMESTSRQERVSKNRVPNKSASPTKIVSKRREKQPVTESTHRKVKTALDETRLLILGAQILLGFHLNAAFQSGFANLGGISRAFYAGAFCAMAAAVGLLITPSMEHLFVERGRSNSPNSELDDVFCRSSAVADGTQFRHRSFHRPDLSIWRGCWRDRGLCSLCTCTRSLVRRRVRSAQIRQRRTGHG